jgi:phage baseplate assembly protein W
MAEIFDGHRMMQTGTDADVERFTDGEALSERVREWLETPQGTLADIPSWGHNLTQFKHDPQGPDLEVAIELAIVQKLEQDISDLEVTGVLVEYLDIDVFRLTIRHTFGGTQMEMQL